MCGITVTVLLPRSLQQHESQIICCNALWCHVLCSNTSLIICAATPSLSMCSNTVTRFLVTLSATTQVSNDLPQIIDFLSRSLLLQCCCNSVAATVLLPSNDLQQPYSSFLSLKWFAAALLAHCLQWHCQTTRAASLSYYLQLCKTICCHATCCHTLCCHALRSNTNLTLFAATPLAVLQQHPGCVAATASKLVGGRRRDELNKHSQTSARLPFSMVNWGASW